MRILSVSVVLVAALLVAAGCGTQATPSQSSSTASGVEGRVLLSGGPVSADHSPSSWPYPTSEVKAVDSSGTVVASAKADAHGAFRIALPPGTYTLNALPTSGNPYFTPVKVTVAAGRLTHADIVAQIP